MTWKAIASAVFALLKDPLTSLAAYFAGLRQGRVSQKEKDQRETLEALRKGADAGDAVKHDPDSVLRDKNNRDT